MGAVASVEWGFCQYYAAAERWRLWQRQTLPVSQLGSGGFGIGVLALPLSWVVGALSEWGFACTMPQLFLLTGREVVAGSGGSSQT